jgi:ABC-type polysaccharide/polyol phosphate transport system ATPase subunit
MTESYIKAQEMTLVFPLLGADSKFPAQLEKKGATPRRNRVGGKIFTDQRGRRGVIALNKVSFDLQHGDRVGLFGHNGAGKSTLLRAMSGIYTPTSGKLTVSGKISSLFNLNIGINKEASGHENIIFKGLMYGMRRREIEALVHEIAEFSELDDYIYMPVKTYSSGMVMRLLFAIATAFKPDIMLLDEWITAGDTDFRKKVDQKMSEMVDEAQIVVVASHDENRLRRWSNKILHMEAGKILETQIL